LAAATCGSTTQDIGTVPRYLAAMPKVVVFRPIDLPQLAPLARLIDPVGALHHVAHFVYPLAEQEQSRNLSTVPEPEAAPELSADLLALDGAAAESLRELLGAADGETLRFGFHAGLTPEEAAAAMVRRGFEVVAPGEAFAPATHGFHSAERLATIETWLSQLSATDPEHVGDVIEQLISETPVPLLRVRAVRNGALQAGALHLTAKSLQRLLEAGALDASGIASLWEARVVHIAITDDAAAAHSTADGAKADGGTAARATETSATATDVPADVPADGLTTAASTPPAVPRSAIRDLAGPIRVMRGGESPPSWGGPGASTATVFLQEGAVDERRPLLPTDVAWSRGGDRVLVVAEQVRVLRRRSRATAIFVESIGGRASFEPARDAPLRRKRAKDSEEVVLSARFDTRGRLLTGWRHGDVRLGPADTDPATHERIARFDEPIFRIGVAPVGRALALIVGNDLVLLTDGRTPRKLGTAWTAMAVDGAFAHLAWTPDGERLGVCVDGDLQVYDASGVRITSCRVAGDSEAHGGVGASERGFFVLRSQGLAWWTPGATLRDIPRALTPREGDLPGHAEAAPGGRAIAAWTMSGGNTPDRAANLEIFDLDRRSAHHFIRQAWNDPVPLTAIAPTGDVYATASGITLQLAPWTLDHERDELADVLPLGRALRKSGHSDEARRVLTSVSTRRVVLGLALRDELDGIARDMTAAAPAKAALPLASPRARPPSAEDLDVDDLVTHARFGKGMVVNVEGRGSTARITVDFSGTERVMPAASLQRAT